MTKQIKLKQRVADHGEVFTNEREVKAMCDLVKDETERIDSKVLEPACGNGNFLAEILNRKLATVERRYSKNANEFERYSIYAVSSLYGVDILEDNAEECRERLFNIWNELYLKIAKNEARDACRDAVKYILKNNILCGDALTLLQSNGEPIIFPEWSLLNGKFMKRRDFHLSTMLDVQDEYGQLDLFASEYDDYIDSYVPRAFKDDYKPLEYWRIQEWG